MIDVISRMQPEENRKLKEQECALRDSLTADASKVTIQCSIAEIVTSCVSVKTTCCNWNVCMMKHYFAWY